MSGQPDESVRFNEDLNADEDEWALFELKEELENKGYTIDGSMDYSVLMYYRDRLYENDTVENDILHEFVQQQRQFLDGVRDSVCESHATYISRGKENSAIENINLTSADITLGSELSNKVSEWVLDAVSTNVNVTDNEIINSFIQSGVVSRSELSFKDGAIRRYVASIRPMYVEMHTRYTNGYLKETENREQLANYLLKAEFENSTALAEAKSYSLIRQVFESADGSCETVCNKCRQRTKIDSPVFRMLAYAHESGTKRVCFCGLIKCEHCGTALLFHPNEYQRMFSSYVSECNKSVDAFISEAKKECAGASVLHANIPVNVIRHLVEDLFVQSGSSNLGIKKCADTSDSITTLVSDDEMLDATKKFYFKLRGLGYCRLGQYTVSDMSLTDYANARSTEWTHHDVAVFVMQCLSREYYLEKNKALFSLIFALKSNPYFERTISMSRIWTLENYEVFLKNFRDRKNPRTLTSEESIELRSILSEFNDKLPEGSDELLLLAQTSVGKIHDVILEKRKIRDRVLASMEKCIEELAYTKMFKVNSCKLADLQQFLVDDVSIHLFNEIADRMLIKTYAAEFYEHWLAVGVVKSKNMNDLFDSQSNMGSVKARLAALCTEKLLFSTASLEKMKPIYTRNSSFEEAIRKLHRDFINSDFYEFCNDIKTISVGDVMGLPVGSRLLHLLQDFVPTASMVTRQSKAEIYLSRDFSIEEINGCDLCSELIFRRYVPKRIPLESIRDYCNRYNSWYNNPGNMSIELYDNFDLFTPVLDYGVELSICSAQQDAEFASFGKTLFMSTVLCDLCYQPNVRERVQNILGASLMQQNIIKTVTKNLISFRSAALDYKFSHAIYLSSFQKNAEEIMNAYDNCDLRVSMDYTEMENVFDLKTRLAHIITGLENRFDMDGEAITDSEDVEQEILSYLGFNQETFSKWIESDT